MAQELARTPQQAVETGARAGVTMREAVAVAAAAMVAAARVEARVEGAA